MLTKQGSAVIILLLAISLIVVIMTRCFWSGNSDRKTMSQVVDVLYRQCARWAVAAQQDENEIIAVLHANYAAGYLWAIKDIVSTDEFKSITGQDFLDFEGKIVKIQDKATRRLVQACRTVVPVQDTELLNAIYGTRKI